MLAKYFAVKKDYQLQGTNITAWFYLQEQRSIYTCTSYVYGEKM